MVCQPPNANRDGCRPLGSRTLAAIDGNSAGLLISAEDSFLRFDQSHFISFLQSVSAIMN
jgi:hypothetical protein